MSLVDVLNAHIEKMEAEDPEIIGGTNIKDVLFAVDLSVAFSPVIPLRGDTDWRNATEVVETQGGEYILVNCSAYRHPVSATELTRMRARYILTRNAELGPRLEAMFRRNPPHSGAQEG
jgi:hypothetical protein